MADSVATNMAPHALALVWILGVLLAAVFTALVALIVWAYRSQQEAIGRRITEGFEHLGDRVEGVAIKLEKSLESVWEKLTEHEHRIDCVEKECAMHHGWDGKDRRR